MRRAKEGEGLQDFHHVMRGTVDVTGKLQMNSAKPSAEFLDAGSGCILSGRKMQVELLAEPKTPLESSVFI